MASSSWCAETDEKINYTKLCRLLVDGGTQAVRAVFDGIHPPSSLKTILNNNKTTLQGLRGRVLNNEQWDKLYPPSGSTPKSEDFDITLLFVLLRNICGLTPPATGWDVLPPITDTSLEANLTRIKYYRNNTVAHKPNTEINDADFEQYWQDISSALVSLGLSQEDIDDLKSARLGEKDYNQLLYDWYISDEDIKTQLEDLKSKTKDIKSDTAAIKSDTADLKSDTRDIKSDTADIKDKLNEVRNACIESHQMDKRIHNLAFCDFKREISNKCQSFHPNTRQWILDQVKSHVDSDQPESCVMLITAGPGMGKSTIAAKICQTYKDLGCLGGCHFFQFSNSTRNNPRLMLQSIARQMCATVAGYGEALERKLQTNLGKQITEMNCEELLTILLEEPLCQLQETESNFVVVLDALDERSYDPKDELMKALRTKLPCLPSWLRFVITSRPSANTSVLGSTVAVEMLPEDESNLLDLKRFFCFELKALYPHFSNDGSEDLVQKLVQMTQGLFLVAFFVIDFLKRENAPSPDEVLELFPNGISSVYENYFSRLKEVLLPYMSEEERFYKMLEAVVASKNPLPVNMFYNILGLKGEREVPRQEKKTRKNGLNSLHWLFPVESDHVTVFHKSVVDWLILEGEKEHDFSVRVEDGNEILANQCYDVLSDIRNGKKDLDEPLVLTDSEKYALKFGCYLIQKSSTVSKADKDEIFCNVYIVAAMTIECACDEIETILCRKLRDGPYFDTKGFHDDFCPLFHDAPYKCYLEFVIQLAHAMGLTRIELSIGTTTTPLDALRKNSFFYYVKNTLIEPSVKTPNILLPRSHPRQLSKCQKEFIAVFHMDSNPQKTIIYKLQRDGHVMDPKFFLGKKFITTSPVISSIVVSEEKGNKIEILDVTTLEVVSQYESPHDQIETCHVFGDDRCWFIVIKGCHDDKIWVIEGLTGQVRHTITVSEDSKVCDVSRQGHILVTRTWTRDVLGEVKSAFINDPTNTFINKHDIVEVMNWKFVLFKSPPPQGREECYYRLFYREMFLYRHECAQEPIPIYPLAEKICQCPRHLALDGNFPTDLSEVTSRFSEDGVLFAYYYKASVFIVNTADGSLFKRLLFGSHLTLIRDFDIVFVSEYYVIMHGNGGRILLLGDVSKDEIKHVIPLPYPYVTEHIFLFPKQEEPFKSLIIDGFGNVSQLVFNNLRL